MLLAPNGSGNYSPKSHPECFARSVAAERGWQKDKRVLYIPVVLVISFLLGYLGVGIFGSPDLLVAGILFGGSIFVFVMYLLLTRITRLVKEHEQLEAKMKTAEESARAKNFFLSGISHEMRTPMNVMIGLNDLALKDPGLAPETRDRLEKLGGSAQLLLGLINNVIDMNSIGSNEFVTRSEEFSLPHTVSQLNAVAGAMCAEKSLTYRCTVAEGTGGSYKGDEKRIQQILMNLLSNAVKYTNAPGEVELSVSSDCGDMRVEVLTFTVRDTGVGIDPDFLPRIFEVFTREDGGSTASQGGSGIGLAVTKNITEMLGGTITAESEKNKGSVFTVTLPVTRVRNEAAPEVSLEGRRILIAEDVAENAEIVADLLELEGAESEHAEKGRIAAEMFKSSRPGYYDAVLMDLRMPEMDGLAAAREIRASASSDAAAIPIIALTANALESDIRDTRAAGMNTHLPKPVDADKLYSTLKAAIGRRESERRS